MCDMKKMLFCSVQRVLIFCNLYLLYGGFPPKNWHLTNGSYQCK